MAIGLSLLAGCNAPKEVAGDDRSLDFTADWAFRLGDDTAAARPDYNDADWRKLNLPHDWAIEGEFSKDNPSGTGGGALPGGIGWYRKTFTADKADEGKRYRIDFDGAYMNSTVYINGHELGTRPYGYISFSYDLTPYIKWGVENVLAVRVDNAEQPNSRWYSGCGIYRNVWLTKLNPAHIAQWGTYVTAEDVSKNSAQLKIRTKLQYDAEAQMADVVLQSRLVDADGNAVGEAVSEAQLMPLTPAEVEQEIHLKNPRLSEMRRFFEKYYVASNMGLILSGDFDTEEVLPILESTFSRIRKGKPPHRDIVALPPFEGREKVSVRIPMPFVKIMALGFRGVPANHPDQVALNIAVSLLNNSNGTGFLDKLTVDHKVMGTMAVNQSMNEAGILGLLVFPKFFFQTYAAAEKLVWKQINRIKEGDFSDEMFQSLKLEQKREYASKLEDINSRAEVMMRIFSQGKSWQDYLDEVTRIDALSREDVIEVAKKYFTENYMYVTKKTGRYPKTILPKPDYSPIIPKNSDASSAYVERLEKIPVQELKPHFLDFEKDAEVVSLRPLVTLYKTHNSVNDIFSLTLSYGVGQLELRDLDKLSAYLPFVATESMSFEVFRGKLQELGSTLTFDSTDSEFLVVVNGFDGHFTQTMAMVGDFLRHAKPDDKKLRQIVDEAKVTEKSLFNSSENVADMLLEKVKFGEQSRYLTKLSFAEIKKLKG